MTTERERVAAALAAEGEAIALPSAEPRPWSASAEESFELVVLDESEAQQDTLTAAREIRPFADVVPIIAGDPARAAEMYTQEAAAVLPRPLARERCTLSCPSPLPRLVPPRTHARPHARATSFRKTAPR